MTRPWSGSGPDLQTLGISKGVEVGCGKGNLQMDKELRSRYNARVGIMLELGTTPEWVGC